MARASTLSDLPRTEAEALAYGRHGDPFKVLGPRDTSTGRVIRAFLPGAHGVEVAAAQRPLDRSASSNRRSRTASSKAPSPIARPICCASRWPGAVQETEDPYSFGPLLGDLDLHLFNEGRHFEMAKVLGANAMTVEGVPGVRFAVWAPNASARRRGRRLQRLGRRGAIRCGCAIAAGVWEMFVPRVAPGARYKYEIVGAGGVPLPQKADPLAQAGRAAAGDRLGRRLAAAASTGTTRDWMAERAERQAPDAPISIYEVHAGSWMRDAAST